MADVDQDTLHLPRILCLHGGGTNAVIFRMQCRVIERCLKSKFRLCFADAPFCPSEPGPDVVSVYKDFGPFRSWLPLPDSAARRTSGRILDTGFIEMSLQLAMAEDDRKGATGEWVGLLGFSQGAKVCACLLYQQQQLLSTSNWIISGRNSKNKGNFHIHNFRFAVLLAGRGPLESPKYDPLLASHQHSNLLEYGTILQEERPTLSLPTIHVHGLVDPGLALHRQLYEHCDANSARLIEWDGEHRVPIKTKDVMIVVAEDYISS